MPAGRPTDYKEEYIEQARAIISVMGSTNVELAAIFGVDDRTLYRWQQEYPEFCQAIKDAKDDYDTKNVEASLRQRAIGYSHPDTKFATHEGVITDQREFTKHHPPDPTSAIFWLKNRNPKRWRDKQEVEHSGAMGVVNMTTDEYKQARSEMLADDDC